MSARILEYGNYPTRRRWTIAVILVVAASLLCGLAQKDRMCKLMNNRILCAYVNECMNVAFPEGFSAFEGDPPRATFLLKAETHRPGPDGSAVYVLPAWEGLRPSVGATNSIPRALLFSHSLHTGDGRKVLVIIEYDWSGQFSGERAIGQFYGYVIDQGGLLDAPTLVGGLSTPLLLGIGPRVHRLKGGSVIETAPADFSIRYEIDGIAGEIYGHLGNDLNVTLKPSSGHVVQVGSGTAEAATLWVPTP